MRSVDERCAAVRGRARRLRRRRNDRVLTILVCLMALPLVDLAGRTAAAGMAESPAAAGGLFGAASLFGPSVGGYVIVAMASFAVAVLVTLLLVFRRRTTSREEDETEAKEERHEKAEGKTRA